MKFKIMNKIKGLFLSVLAVFSAYITNAQIIVTNVETPQELVQNVLVGTGVTISNVEYNSSAIEAQNIQVHAGYFDANNTTFPIQEGLILATCNVSSTVGPNTGNLTDWVTPGATVNPDPDVVAINTNTTVDQAMIEFDFIPTGDSIEFKYVFASDEYTEFSPSSWNDCFGFFLSGPGISGSYEFGGENIALLPTGETVTINNVHPTYNSQYYVDTPTDQDYAFDGRTVVLTAAASVQCGETYHIKLAIADAGDGNMDSGVFIEASSFSSNAPDINIQLVDINGDPLVGNELIEGCTGAAINLIKPNGYTDSSYVVNILVSGTATNGTDYTQINPSYTIPPGSDTLTVLIDALADALPESTETLLIETYYVTPCGDTISVSANINIIDNPPAFNVFANDTTLDCPQSFIDVTAWTDGGIPNLVYDWGSFGTGPTASLPGDIPGTTQYTVTVTDECGMVQDTTVNVTLNAAPVPTINFNQNTFTICPGDQAFIDASIANPYDINQLTFDWQPTGETTEDITVSPSVLTWYYLTIDDGCYNVTDSVKVDMGTVTLTDISIINATSCPGLGGFTPGEVHVLPDDNTWTYTLTGTSTFGPQNDGDFNAVGPGSYFLNVINDDGCSIDTAITVGTDANIPDPVFVLDSVRDVTCFGYNDGGAYVNNIESIPTPTPPYDVTWTSTQGVHFSETVAGQAGGDGDSEVDDLYGGQWIVTVTDDEGCPWSHIFTIEEPDELTLTWLSNDPTCYQFSDGSVTINTTGGNGGNTFSIWDETQTLINGGTTTANTLEEGWYYGTITDTKGCTITDSVFIDDPDELDVDWTILHPLCYGSESGSITIDTVYNTTGDYGQVGFFLNPNTSGLPQGIGANFYNHLAEGSYSLTINDDNGCSKQFDFDIIYPEEMYFTQLGADPAYCRLFGYQSGNGVVYASGAGGTGSLTYTWTDLQSDPVQTSNNTTWGGLNPGQYFISVQDGNGCYLTDTITVDSLNPVADFDVDSDLLTMLDASTYEGTAVVCATFNNTSQNYNNPNSPNPNPPTFLWTLDNPAQPWVITHDASFSPDTCYDSAGEYDVCLIATNKNGCQDTLCKTMIIYDPLEFKPVNIFTPNGDGDNDIFTFEFVSQAVETFQCTIVNRWGRTIYEITDINQGWNGTDASGSDVPDGIYFYIYEGVSTDQTEFSGQGNIHLIRGK